MEFNKYEVIKSYILSCINNASIFWSIDIDLNNNDLINQVNSISEYIVDKWSDKDV